MQKLKALSPIVLVAALLVGCGGGGTAKLASNDAAVVGKTHITESQVAALLDSAKASYKAQGRAFPKQGTTDYASVKGGAVALLVQQAMREDKANAIGVSVSEKDVQARITAFKKQYFGGSEKKYEAELKKQHVTLSQVHDDFYASLVSDAVFAKVTKSVTVSDAQVHTYYVGHPSSYQQPASRDVRYILVGKSKAVAESVYNQLKAGNTQTWCKLAKKYAKDASGQNCGKATFTKGQTVAVFDNAAFQTATNVIHPPFYDPTNYKAWFVMEPIAPVKKASSTPEKQVAASIRQQLLQTDKNQAMTKWVDDVTKSYCSGSKIKYAVGITPSPDPCAAATTTTDTTTTG
jgi:hypothetical protein